MQGVATVVRFLVKDVLCISSETLSLEASVTDYCPSNLKGRPLDWVVPLPKGKLVGYAKLFNEKSPNGRLRDIRQDRYDLDEWGAEDEHLVIRDRIRDLLRGLSGKQVYSIKFYQVPAPKFTKRDNRRKREYLEEVFRAQDAISTGEWIREPQILLESGHTETMLGDAADAKWVADIFEQLNQEYAPIGFAVDLEASDDPEQMIRELPEGSVKKLRAAGLDTDTPEQIEHDISKSTII